MYRKTCTPEPSLDEKEAKNFYRSLEVDILARTIWGEARGEGTAGMQAVAAVVMNRVKRAEEKGGYWWGNDVIAVCQKPYQFSCWNKNDPNYQKLLEVDEKDLYYATAKRIAARALSGVQRDPTHGANHYHASGIAPNWAVNEKPVAVIGRHIFYNL